MKKCKNCKASCTGAGKEGNAPDCTFYTDEGVRKMSNADRIRSMTDEELEKMLFEIIDKEEMCNHCVPEKRNEIKCNGKCRNGILKWLQSEVES